MRCHHHHHHHHRRRRRRHRHRHRYRHHHHLSEFFTGVSIDHPNAHALAQGCAEKVCHHVDTKGVSLNSHPRTHTTHHTPHTTHHSTYHTEVVFWLDSSARWTGALIGAFALIRTARPCAAEESVTRPELRPILERH